MGAKVLRQACTWWASHCGPYTSICDGPKTIRLSDRLFADPLLVSFARANPCCRPFVADSETCKIIRAWESTRDSTRILL